MSSSSSKSSLAEHNEVPLNRAMLTHILNDLSSRLLPYFGGKTVRLVVHGGAIMVLHPLLACRESTRDVDYNHRSFEAEWIARGVMDAGPRLRTCIADTARAFNLGRDWMNSCADVALPMSYDQRGKMYDPIHADAITPNNVKANTIFSSPGLVLVGVSWSWQVALKLVRYQKDDPRDIACVLRLGQKQRGVHWTRQILESWLLAMCSPMGYATYPPWQMDYTRQKMRHAISLSHQVH